MFQTFKEFENTSIVHGFFGRKGGVSQGIFNSLNTSFVSGDNQEAVRQNRDIICKALNIKDIATLYQHHSADCVVVNECAEGSIKADALVTTVRGLAIGIQTADCGPVLFRGEGPDGPVIGAAHAGWGGAVKGILENTISTMITQGARLETIQAAVGPTIGPESYEVSESFLNPFIKDDPDSLVFFKPGLASKFWFNLPTYIKFRLMRAGIGQVFLSEIDTYKNEAEYFSFRRSTHKNEKEYGRQLSVIALL